MSCARIGLGGILSFIGAVTYDEDEDNGTDSTTEDSDYYYDEDDAYNGIIYAILLFCWGLSTVWTQIEDRGDYLLITYGPCRWLLCGMGKEKVYYRNIRDYQISKSCFYGFGIPCCTSIKLFNTCSCCCGDANASFCGHKTVKLTIRERPQGLHAIDDNEDCCAEKCCLQCCYGDNGDYCGKGCCCQPCCNPCDANFCAMNTIFVSTNDVEGVMQLLNEKAGIDGDGNNVTYATI